MARSYRKSPIAEAICEFQFVPTEQWDLTIPGLMYEKISSNFPQKKRRVGIGIQFKQTEAGVEQRVEAKADRMQFLNADGTVLVQVGPDLLAVNKLKPYEKWPTFRSTILEHLGIYRGIARPKGFKRIGLRYINRIEFQAAPVTLEEFFNFYPHVPERIPQVHADFLSRIEIPFGEGRDLLLLTMGAAPPDEHVAVSIILDLDYILARPEVVSLDDAEEWLEQAHTRVENVFEASITDKSRVLFEEVIE